MKMNKVYIPLLAVGASLIGSAAFAATATGTMGVSATVTRSCTVTVDALAFPITGVDVASTSGAISVDCTAGDSTTATPTVTFGLGGNSNLAQRRAVHGTSATTFLAYNLYSDAARTVAVSDTTAVATTKDTADGISYTGTIHAEVPASSNKQLGSYSDTVTVTVTYADQ